MNNGEDDDDITPPEHPVALNPENFSGVRVLQNLTLAMRAFSHELFQLTQAIARDVAPLSPVRWGQVAASVDTSGDALKAAAHELRRPR